jgi:hypothetical protein
LVHTKRYGWIFPISQANNLDFSDWALDDFLR